MSHCSGSQSHSMIGYWHHTVVCLSVCNTVYCGDQGWYTVMFRAGNFLLTSSDNFAVGFIG